MHGEAVSARLQSLMYSLCHHEIREDNLCKASVSGVYMSVVFMLHHLPALEALQYSPALKILRKKSLPGELSVHKFVTKNAASVMRVN